jgi:SPP1 family predicted phage head-tail adaptor
MNRPKFKTYNDGVVRIYRAKEKKTDFNARRNVSTIDDLEFVARLDYEESARREQDFEFAEQNGFSLTLKINTRFVPGVDNKCKAIIDGYLYDIHMVDSDRTDMWLYMEGVGKLAAE